MKLGVLIAGIASLAIFAACSKKDDAGVTPPVGQNSSPSQSTLAAPPVPEPSSSEMKKKVLDACTATPVGIEHASVDVLADLQEQMRCIENFLSDNKKTEHWKQAYANRSKVMLESMIVIKALNEPKADGAGSDIANAQRTLMDREKFKKLKSENYNYVKRAINEITTSITYSLFIHLKNSGVQMVNPKEDIEASNRQAKQTGVWGSTIDSEMDNGEFVISRWVTETSPMFKIAGYGSVSIITKIEDDYFDDNGAFSNKCKVYLGVTQTRLSYDCVEYLTAAKSAEVAKAMNSLISEDMAKNANRTN